jgi:DNA-binding winged helix-turn-helix (wHTH) protein/tetratricopeptide (TPR) repeat protein
LVPASQSKEVVRFGPFEADRTAGELRKHGIKLKLQELPFRLLVSLLERPGEVVTREELQAKLWPEGTFVDFERGLGTALNKVREALGDSAANPRFIETIPRRGYRFIGEVERNGAPHPSATTPPMRPWRKKYAMASAVAIVLAVGSAYTWYRTQAKPLTNQDVLVLADFTNSTGDPLFDGTLREALAFQLEQSPFLKVLDDEVMRQDLQLMGRSPQERVTNDFAHDICVREAEKAMLGGSIASLGKSYAIELKATNCQTGATLARQQAEAPDKEHVLQAIASAAQGMRAKLGESLSSIQKLAPPYFRVTTSSLEAFQSFTAGEGLFLQSRYAEAIPLLQHATELDPNLAFAWIWLASASLNTGGGNRARFLEYSDRAWALRDRVSQYERLWLTGSQYSRTGRWEKGPRLTSCGRACILETPCRLFLWPVSTLVWASSKRHYVRTWRATGWRPGARCTRSSSWTHTSISTASPRRRQWPRSISRKVSTTSRSINDSWPSPMRRATRRAPRNKSSGSLGSRKSIYAWKTRPPMRGCSASYANRASCSSTPRTWRSGATCRT